MDSITGDFTRVCALNFGFVALVGVVFHAAWYLLKLAVGYRARPVTFTLREGRALVPALLCERFYQLTKHIDFDTVEETNFITTTCNFRRCFDILGIDDTSEHRMWLIHTLESLYPDYKFTVDGTCTGLDQRLNNDDSFDITKKDAKLDK